MKQLLIILSFFLALAGSGQTYNPNTGTLSNKPYSPAQAVPTDSRSYFYDATNLKWRAYQSTAEVLSYLNLSKYRAGNFPIYVHSGGTLNGNGTYTGGTVSQYWFKDGVTNGDLVAFSAGGGWSLTGDAGTTAGTNFIGTTDPISLAFKLNSVNWGKLDYDYGNISFGQTALNNNASGQKNIAIGQQSLYSNTTGYYNIGLSQQSLYNNTTGINNIALGLQSLFSNTTGDYNIANGYQSLNANNTGYKNVAIGYQTLYNNTTGYNNIAIGEQTLYSNTTAGGNIGIGNGGNLYNNTTGYGNIGIGNAILYSNTTGLYNVGVGFQNLSGGASNSNNTAIGTFVLNSISFTGSNNTGLGYNTLSANTSGQNNIGIGYYAGTYNTTGSNQIFINSIDRVNYSGDQTESPIYIQQSATLANQNIYLGGNVGIGALSPAACALLEINTTNKGLLLPRMTKAQRNLIGSPVAGLMVYQTDNTPGLRVYNGTNWMKFTEATD